MRISDWSSDVCSSDLAALVRAHVIASVGEAKGVAESLQRLAAIAMEELLGLLVIADALLREHRKGGFASHVGNPVHADAAKQTVILSQVSRYGAEMRSEEHTSELQSLMRISSAVFCLKKKKITHNKKPSYR